MNKALLTFAVLLLVSFAAHAGTSGCEPFRCQFDQDCADGVCVSGLCAGVSHVDETPVKRDSLALGATSIRTTETTEGPQGSFRVEALASGSPVASLEWSYSIVKGVEEWTITGTQTFATGSVYVESLTFDTNGRSDGGFPSPFFFDLSDWLFQKERVGSPLWLGDLGLTAGVDQWQLLSREDCVACDFPGCNCS